MAAEPGDSTAALVLPGRLAFQGGSWYLLAKAGLLARRRWAAMLAELTVSPNQYGALMALDELGPLGQHRLAEVIGIDPRNAVPIIDTLVEQGLVGRKVDPSDRRRRVLALTAKGRGVAGDLATVGAEIEKDLFSSLAPAEQVSLRRMLLALLGAAEEPGR